MRIKSLITILLLICFLLINCSSDKKDYKKVQKTDGKTILQDSTLFTVDFYKKVQASLDVTDNPIFAGEFSLKVPSGEEPNITELYKKYGMPNKKEFVKHTVGIDQGIDLITHWYGEFGFGVPKDAKDKSSANRVVWIYYKRKN